MTDTQEQMEKAKDEFLKGNLNFPVGTHEAVAKVLGVPVETVQRIRENRNREAQHRIKLREAVDNENILHTVWDNRGCDLTKDGNRLKVEQLNRSLPIYQTRWISILTSISLALVWNLCPVRLSR